MRFSKKTAHRIIIASAMVLPIAYLLGTQVAVLAGAHGEQIIATDVRESGQEYREVDSFSDTGSYRFTWDTSYSSLGNRNFVFDFTLNGNLFTRMDSYAGGTAYIFNSAGNASYFMQNGSFTYQNPVFYFDVESLPFGFPWLSYGTLEMVVEYDSSTLYSESLFGSFFPRDNFVEKIGQNAISETPKGFTPFATMLRYIDINMLHAGDTQIGSMVYGMIYWMLHVVMADLIYHVLVFIPNLIMAVCQWFGHGLDDDKGE